ncbi:16S rRNA (guanine(966)-N(2))-methyltransferase RsmD [Myxococcota bacterium]|nr:16S rRNA (guanine(966)-N(2))-methyltransferase RsmD [Myxococcota bacterium]
MVLRIHGHAFGKRKLVGPAGPDRRPTRSRVRKSIFDILGQRLDGLRVLDLFAGLGAFGIEAVGRGGMEAVFVEKDRTAARALTDNARALLPPGSWRVVQDDVAAALRDLGRRGARFDLVFADPPYDAGLAPRVPGWLAGGEVLSPGARLVVEHSAREDLPEGEGALVRVDERRYGGTRVTFYAQRESAKVDGTVEESPDG